MDQYLKDLLHTEICEIEQIANDLQIEKDAFASFAPSQLVVAWLDGRENVSEEDSKLLATAKYHAEILREWAPQINRKYLEFLSLIYGGLLMMAEGRFMHIKCEPLPKMPAPLVVQTLMSASRAKGVLLCLNSGIVDGAEAARIEAVLSEEVSHLTHIIIPREKARANGQKGGQKKAENKAAKLKEFALNELKLKRYTIDKGQEGRVATLIARSLPDHLIGVVDHPQRLITRLLKKKSQEES